MLSFEIIKAVASTKGVRAPMAANRTKPKSTLAKPEIFKTA
jgi:hypothetical protein